MDANEPKPAPLEIDWGDQKPAPAPAPVSAVPTGAPSRPTTGRVPAPAPRPAVPAPRPAAPAAPQAQEAAPEAPARRPKPPCIRHAEIESSNRCDVCRKPMCKLCDFSFPGNVHVCPECVTASPPGVSAGRLGRSIGGIALTVAALAFWGALFTGALGQHSPGAAAAMFVWLILLPGLAGFSLGLSAIDRRLGNNPLLWISAALGSLFTVTLVVIILIGNLSR